MQTYVGNVRSSCLHISTFSVTISATTTGFLIYIHLVTYFSARNMASIFENARRNASQLAAEVSAPSWTARRSAFALHPLTRSGRDGRTANPAEVRQQRERNLNQQDQARRHVRSTGQSSTTEATDREAAQHASPSSCPPPSSPPETAPPDLAQATPNGGWTITGFWRKARGIDLEAEADKNPIGFLGILIGLASLIVAVAALVWSVIQGIASLVLAARSSSTGEAMHQAGRRIEAAWTDVRRRAAKLAHHIGSSLPAPSFHRIHARQWDHPMQEKRDT